MTFKLQLVHVESSELLDEWSIQLGVEEVDVFNLQHLSSRAIIMDEVVGEIARYDRHHQKGDDHER